MEVGLEQLGSGIKGVNGLPMLGGGVRTSRVLHVFRHGCVLHHSTSSGDVAGQIRKECGMD